MDDILLLEWAAELRYMIFMFTVISFWGQLLNDFCCKLSCMRLLVIKTCFFMLICP